jgi:glycosyltransferase involved in cell wall biosynthesis
VQNERELRILQICSSSAVSGAETNVLALTSNLRKRGHFVQAVTPGDGWLPNALFEDEIPNHVMGMKGTGWWRTVGYGLKQIRRNNIDVVHTHLTRAAYIGHMIGLLSRKPIITSVHVANNDNIYRRLAKRSNRLVAVSDFVRGMLHGKGVPDRYIDTVYNGTDILSHAFTDPFLTRRSLGIDPDKNIIGVVGRVCREKGHVEMLQALKQILQSDPSAHLLLVGRLVQNFEAEFYDELNANGLKENVTLTGERYDVSAMLDAVDISAMPSYMETFGIAALEAMARGKAVVATRVGGLPEVVRDGQTGLLVDLEVDDIASAVNYLLANENIRNSMGIRGREIVEEQFTLEHMVSRFETVYRRSMR